jgi:hypothetical protein
MASVSVHDVKTVWTTLKFRRQLGEKDYDISWAHVELEAGLGKLKQAADAKHEDHRVEMACRCQQPSPV